MSEILFRGKTKQGKWVFWNYCCVEKFDKSGYEYILIEIGEDGSSYEIIPETIGLFTGLTDKNGKKIFEGDIVKCRHRWNNHNFGGTDEEIFYNQKIKNAYGKYKETTNGLYDNFYYYRNYCVEYFSRNGRYRVRNGGQFHDLTYSFILNHNIEVIGNIHDNKELLGE